MSNKLSEFEPMAPDYMPKKEDIILVAVPIRGNVTVSRFPKGLYPMPKDKSYTMCDIVGIIKHDPIAAARSKRDDAQKELDRLLEAKHETSR